MPVEYQIIIIYAAVKKLLLDIAVEDILAFESGLLIILRQNIRKFQNLSRMTKC